MKIKKLSTLVASSALLLILLCSNTHAFAQTKTLDSLLSVINRHPKRDSAKVVLIISYVQTAVNENTTGLLPLLNEEINISKEIGFKRGMQSGYITGQMYYADRGDFSRAFQYADSAFAISKGDTAKQAILNIAYLHHNIAGDYFKIGAYDDAIRHYNEAAILFSKYAPNLVSATDNGIAMVYENMMMPEKAKAYFLKGITSAEQYGNKKNIAQRYLGYITWFINQKKFDSAQKYLLQVRPVVVEINDAISSFLFYQNSGYVAQHEKRFTTAIELFKKTYNLTVEADDVYRRVTILEPLCGVLMEAGSMQEARAYIDTMLMLSQKHSLAFGKLNALTKNSEWYEKTGDLNSALRFLKRKMELADSISSDDLKEKISVTETRFKVQAKDNEIKILQGEKQIHELSIRQKNTLNYILIGGAAALVVIMLLGYRNYTHRQKLQQQRITELETQQQLTATEAVLKGEEQERTRLAKDLHDGLGGMLSGIKFSLNTMKGNLIMTPENVQAFERSVDMLDSSIKEMRRVAHNMMPEALVKFGLDIALQDFCNDINQSGALKIAYQSIGMQSVSMDQTMAITIYRVVQELINNTIKHAGATNAVVQLACENKKLSLTVEDDGKGFDTARLPQSTGIGWNSIKNRIEILKGQLDVQSGHMGTSVHIELNIS